MGSVYVLNQPKHVNLSLVVVGDEFPFSDRVHNKLEELCSVSDVVFIFSKDNFKNQRRINFKKICSLYNCCAYIDGGKNLPINLLRTIRYDIAIFENHINYLIMNSWDIEDFDIEKINKYASSTLVNPIFKPRRLEAEEFFEIYKKQTIQDLILGKNKVDDNLFCSYTTDSSILCFKNNSIKDFLKYSEDNLEYVKTFVKEDIRYFIVSTCIRAGINITNIDFVKELKL